MQMVQSVQAIGQDDAGVLIKKNIINALDADESALTLLGIEKWTTPHNDK